VKFVIAERESEALGRCVAAWRGGLASSVVAAVEVPRAARRMSAAAEARAREVLEAVVLLELSAEVYERAVEVEPAILRSLDAIHLASALSLDTDLGPFVTYDARQQQAAQAAGLRILTPA
jgi:hypothetical protein